MTASSGFKCKFVYLSHLFVGGEKLLVSGILEVVLLKVSPEFLDAFSAASLIFSNDGGEVSAKLHGFGESGSFRHD